MALDLAVLAMFAACYAVSARVHRTAPRVLRKLWLLAAAGVAAVLALANIYGVLSGSPGFGYKDRIVATVLAVLVLVWVVRLKQASRARKET
jgi:fatty acid desaturase